MDNCIKWNEKFYDEGPAAIKRAIEANNSNGILYIEYQYYQIGLTNEWLRNISNKIGDPLTVRREILLQRLAASDRSPYPKEDIEYIASTKSEPISSLFINQYYQFDVYEELRRNIPYIVGIDCSSGTSSDNNAITIINPYTVRPVADFKCPYIGETEYEKLIISLVSENIPRAIVCIERNSMGDGIIDHLMNSKIATRLYFDKDRDLVAARMKQAESVESMLKHRSRLKTYYGVYTEGKSREDMFAILSRRVSEFKDDFVTKNIIEDLAALVVTNSGKIESGPGKEYEYRFKSLKEIKQAYKITIFRRINMIINETYDLRDGIAFRHEVTLSNHEIGKVIEFKDEEQDYMITKSAKVFRISTEKQVPITTSLVKSRNNTLGYPRFSTTVVVGGERKHRIMTLHRVYGLAFIENIHNYPCLNHIDGVKSHCSMDNLEWVTYSENNKHAFRTGLKKPTIRRPEESNLTRHTKDDVIKVCELLRSGMRMKDIPKEYPQYGYPFVVAIRRKIIWKDVVKNYEFPNIKRYSRSIPTDQFLKMYECFDKGYGVHDTMKFLNMESNENNRGMVKYYRAKYLKTILDNKLLNQKSQEIHGYQG